MKTMRVVAAVIECGGEVLATQRGYGAFCMGNALVVGVPHRIGVEIAKRAKE